MRRTLTIESLLERLQQDGRRRPVAFTAALTYRCNLACRHCYCRLPADGPTPRPELATTQWHRLIGEAADAGALFATFTGGEPLLRDDFAELWRYARSRGLIVELFTNASLIDAELARFLAEWTPRQVSVTLYGASEETYQRMAGRAGLHERVLRGLDLLVEHGVPVEVKSVVTRGNVHELAALRTQAERYQSTFKWDAELTGCLPESGGNPAAERLTPEEIIALEQADPARMADWRAQVGEALPEAPGNELFRCRVAEQDFHLDPYGMLLPCLMLTQPGYDALGGSIAEGWEQMPAAVGKLEHTGSECGGCRLAQLCRSCPAHALLAGERPGAPVPFLCDLGHRRVAMLHLTD